MRRSLMWGLGISVALSAAALWTPKPSRLVAAVQPAASERPQRAVISADRGAATARASLPPLPLAFEPTRMEPATRDFFQAVIAPAPSAPVATVVVQAPVAVPPSPPPAMTYRYFGRMSTPDGVQVTYLSDGDRAIPISLGDTLDNGYKVDRIDEDGIHLVYGPSGQGALISVPSGS